MNNTKKARPNARKISTQHLATLLDRAVKELAKRPQHLAPSKNVAKKFDHFQTRSNTIGHLATCCYRVAKRVQHVACNNVAKCCLAGPLLSPIKK